MSWLDAHECFVMDIVVRDRMEDLRSTIDVATAPTEATVATTGAVPDARGADRAGVARVCLRAPRQRRRFQRGTTGSR